MKPSDITGYVFDVTVGLVLLSGLITADVMHLFGEDRSLQFRLIGAGVYEVKAIAIVVVAYVAGYAILSRMAWKGLHWIGTRLSRKPRL